MIYYPLSVLMLAGIREILIISTSRDLFSYQQLFGDGREIGLEISYAIQDSPDGLAQAFIIGREFIGQDPVALILGDNIFYGQGFTPLLRKVAAKKLGATVFAYKVKDPERFGVVQFDQNRKAISIEEKPQEPRSNYAIPGLYFYDNSVIEIAKNIKPSYRNELEITEINKYYLKEHSLHVEILGRGFTWLDSGTHESLLEASQFVEAIEKRQGFKIACIEEIAYYNRYISKGQLVALAELLPDIEYRSYLLEIADKF